MEDLHDLTLDLIAALELLEETNSASLVAVPLRALQRLVGVLTIALPGAHRFSPEEVATSAAVAEALAAWLRTRSCTSR